MCMVLAWSKMPLGPLSSSSSQLFHVPFPQYWCQWSVLCSSSCWGECKGRGTQWVWQWVWVTLHWRPVWSQELLAKTALQGRSRRKMGGGARWEDRVGQEGGRKERMVDSRQSRSFIGQIYSDRNPTYICMYIRSYIPTYIRTYVPTFNCNCAPPTHSLIQSWLWRITNEITADGAQWMGLPCDRKTNSDCL